MMSVFETAINQIGGWEWVVAALVAYLLVRVLWKEADDVRGTESMDSEAQLPGVRGADCGAPLLQALHPGEEDRGSRGTKKSTESDICGQGVGEDTNRAEEESSEARQALVGGRRSDRMKKLNFTMEIGCEGLGGALTDTARRFAKHESIQDLVGALARAIRGGHTDPLELILLVNIAADLESRFAKPEAEAPMPDLSACWWATQPAEIYADLLRGETAAAPEAEANTKPAEGEEVAGSCPECDAVRGILERKEGL